MHSWVQGDGKVALQQKELLESIRQRQDVKRFQELIVERAGFRKEPIKRILERNHEDALTTEEFLGMLGIQPSGFFRTCGASSATYIHPSPETVPARFDKLLQKYFPPLSAGRITDNPDFERFRSEEEIASQLYNDLINLRPTERFALLPVLLTAYFMYRNGYIFFISPNATGTKKQALECYQHPWAAQEEAVLTNFREAFYDETL